jgi:hypothetical protein
MSTLDLFEKLLAGAIVFACAALLLRQFIGAPRRYRLDSMMRRSARYLRATALGLYHWPSARRAARREAEAAIRRARGDAGSWEGNVYRPKSFRNKSRKLH